MALCHLNQRAMAEAALSRRATSGSRRSHGPAIELRGCPGRRGTTGQAGSRNTTLVAALRHCYVVMFIATGGCWIDLKRKSMRIYLKSDD
jgi:hypothetical protein